MVNTGGFILVLTVLVGLCGADMFVVDEYNGNYDPFLYKLNDVKVTGTTVTLGDHNVPYNVLLESQKNRIFVNCISLVIIVGTVLAIGITTVCCYKRRLFKNDRICRRPRFDSSLPTITSSVSSTLSLDSNDYKPLDDSTKQQQQKSLNKKALRLTLPSQFTNNDYLNMTNNSKYVNLSNFGSCTPESPVNKSPPAYDRIINECKMSKKIHLKIHKIINSTNNNDEKPQQQTQKDRQNEEQILQQQQQQQQHTTKPKSPSKIPKICFRTRLTKIEEEIGKDSQFETINQDLPTYNQYMDKRI